MEHFKEAAKLFLDLRGRLPSQRRQTLDELWRSAPDVARELERLLAHDVDGSSFLERPVQIEALLHEAPATPPPALTTLTDFHVVPERVGRYRVLGVIGAGGMGVVYRAVQERPRREVAVKVLRRGGTAPEMLRRFELEAEALGRLRHAGIAQIYEAGVADLEFANGATAARPFLAMELLSGDGLGAFLARHDLSVRQRLALFAQICDAVQHAHQNGVIHRDLKPGNIIVVGSDGSTADANADAAASPSAKILDFGIARLSTADATAYTHHTAPAQMLGTLLYMSPEQLFGQTDFVDTRTDIYSLGVILYEMLAGRPPYESPDHSLAELIRLRETTEPPALRTLVPRLDEDVATIVHKSLARAPEQRYTTAAELAADVRRYLAGFPITARRLGTWYWTRKWIVRHRAMFAAAVVTASALVFGIGAALYELRAAKRAATRAENAARDAVAARAEAESVIGFLVETLTSADPERRSRDVLVRDVLDDMAPQLAERWHDQPRVEARLRDAIGRTYASLGMLDDAHTQLAAAVDLYRRELGVDAPRTIDAERQLAATRSSLGQYAEAKPLLEHAYAAMRATQGPEDAETLAALSDLGLNDQQAMNLQAALQTWRDVLAAGEPRYGSGSPLVLDTKDRMAALLVRMGNLDEAEQLGRAVLAALSNDAPGAAHLRVSVSRTLAMVYRARGDLENALTYQNAVLDDLRTRLGPKHPDTLGATHDLALILIDFKRYDAAESLLRQVAGAATQLLGPDHPNTLKTQSNLAIALDGLGRIDEARTLLEDTLQRQRATLGPDHVETSDTLQSLAKLAQQRGDDQAAEAYAAEAVQILSARVGSEHVQTAVAHVLHGRCLVRLERFPDAEAELLAAQHVLAAAPPPQRRHAADAVTALIDCYRGWGKPDEARHWEALAPAPPTVDTQPHLDDDAAMQTRRAAPAAG